MSKPLFSIKKKYIFISKTIEKCEIWKTHLKNIFKISNGKLNFTLQLKVINNPNIISCENILVFFN